MSTRRRVAMVASLLCLSAPLMSALAAQTTLRDSTQSVAVSQPAAAVAPVVATTDSFAAPLMPVGVTPSRATMDSPATVGTARAAHSTAAAAQQGSRSTGMMLVGGAALLVGALVGGKAGGVIMVGGAIVGLIGLWRYLE